MNRNTKSITDILIIFAICILLVSAVIWWLAPPDLLKSSWILGIYKVWIPFVALVIASPIAVLLGRGLATNGFLPRWVRNILLVVVAILAVVRVATPSPYLPSYLNLDKPAVQALQQKANQAGIILGGVRPPPIDIKEPAPTPFPIFLGDSKPGDEKVRDHATELHQAELQNAGNKKAENYIAQAAATAAALYIMSEIPPPANAVVAKVVGQILMSMFGDGDLDPGEAMFIGQLVVAAISGDPAQVKAVFEKSDIGLHALEKAGDMLSKNQDLIKKLTEAGQDPSKITALIEGEMKNRGIIKLSELTKVFARMCFATRLVS